MIAAKPPYGLGPIMQRKAAQVSDYMENVATQDQVARCQMFYPKTINNLYGHRAFCLDAITEERFSLAQHPKSREHVPQHVPSQL